MSNNAIVSRVENDGKTLVLEREFNAPRDLVFKAYTEAEHLKHWWGPRGFEVTHCTVDFRPGGVWHYCMKCTDPNMGEWFGMESWGKGIYHEINAPQSFTYTDYFSDAEGNENTEMPATKVRNEFVDLGNGKMKIVSYSEYATAEALKQVKDMGMMQGITETMDNLEAYLKKIS
ncbi:SRPBCC family protein [Paenibacillus abyssi]|uniref:Activator of HSP90 ATPase n=1 Tax=Paenibacillus abyssi TaxID=1340531 RepID=A0A917LI31_9BACL|nr:SRPBCC domain-containing protein [Paenibacillus abyssi]GGG25347.1 activator of HSP90 ATPase [Paenibacillus abyssi]